MFKQDPVPAPSELDVMAGRSAPQPVDESELAEQIRKQDWDLMRSGLKRAGVSQAMVDKLEAIDGINPNAGKFLVSSLGMSHKMMIYSNIQLLEQAEYIKTKYLEDESMESMEKIEWQKAYNEIVDIIGKGYDRVLAGTQAMAKIMASQSDDEKGGKAKPGFKPLKRVNASKN